MLCSFIQLTEDLLVMISQYFSLLNFPTKGRFKQMDRETPEYDIFFSGLSIQKALASSKGMYYYDETYNWSINDWLSAIFKLDLYFNFV